MKRHFSEEVQVANKYRKQCSALMVIRELQIKTILKFLLTLESMAIHKKSNSNVVARPWD